MAKPLKPDSGPQNTFCRVRSSPWIPGGSLPLLLPFFGLLLVFWLIPLLGGIGLSLQSNALYGETEFVGLRHFREVLFDVRFGTALHNTLLYTFGCLVLLLPGALFLALLLRRAWSKLRGLLAYLLLVPALTPPIVLGVLFLNVFHGREGLLNQLFVLPFANRPIQWLTDPDWILLGLILQAVWRWTGFLTFFLLCGLDRLPRGPREAARLDGAGAWEIFWSITLPQLQPILLFCGAYLFIDAFTMFNGAYVLLGGSGSTADAGLLLISYVYQTAFQPNNQFGTAAAMSLIVVPFLFLFLYLLFFHVWRRDET